MSALRHNAVSPPNKGHVRPLFRSYVLGMPTTRRLAASAVGGLVALVLCGCTPRPPGFVVVGRDSHGTTVGGMVVCSDPPDHAVFEATAQVEKSPPAVTQARWQFEREALQRGHLITWALLGSTDRDSIRSLTTLEVAPEDAMSLYVQRNPQDGASGIDFTMTQVNELPVSQFLYRDSHDKLRRGTEADVLSVAHC